MVNSISHDIGEESLECKVQWFQALPLSERMDIFCAYMDLILDINPEIPEQKNAQPPQGRFQVISEA